MERLETVRELDWVDGFRVYGENLLGRLQELHPSTPMVGRFKDKGTELYFRIKRGNGILAVLNPFAEKLVEVYEHDDERWGWLPPTVAVYASSLREDVKKIVPEFNRESGKTFGVKLYLSKRGSENPSLRGGDSILNEREEKTVEREKTVETKLDEIPGTLRIVKTSDMKEINYLLSKGFKITDKEKDGWRTSPLADFDHEFKFDVYTLQR